MCQKLICITNVNRFLTSLRSIRNDALSRRDRRGNRRLRRRFPLSLVSQTPVIPNGAKRSEESVEIRYRVKI